MSVQSTAWSGPIIHEAPACVCAVDAGWFGPKLPSTPWFWPQPRSAARDNCSGEQHDRFRTRRETLTRWTLSRWTDAA